MNDLPRASQTSDVVRGRRVHSERSMGLRQRRNRAFEVLMLAGASLALGCGDDKPAKDQTVFWFQLSQSQGQQCSSVAGFSLPDETARGTIVGASGQGERLVDGDDGAIVECRVQPGAAAGQYNVSVYIQSDTVARFDANGTVTKTGEGTGTGTFDVNLASSFSLGQTGCTATAQEAVGGALWIKDLTCPALRDPSSPAISCTGTGGFIIENCSR